MSKPMTKASSLSRQDLLQERPANFFLHVEDALLAAAGVDQDAERERQIRFGGEVLDGLRSAVLSDVEVTFGQVGDERALFVFDVEKQLHHVDINFQRLLRLLVVAALVGASLTCPAWTGRCLACGRLGRRRIVGLGRR